MVISNPPPQLKPAGGGAGAAGANANSAGAAPPTIQPHENCPAMPPAAGTPCNLGMICDYGTPMPCSPTPAYRANCSSGTWVVSNANPTCNPPPPPKPPVGMPPPGEDAGA